MQKKIYWTRRSFVCELFGDVVIGDIENTLREFSSDARSDQIDCGLIDLSKVDVFNVDVEDAVIPAAHDIGFSVIRKKSIKFAFVATDSTVIHFIQC